MNRLFVDEPIGMIIEKMRKGEMSIMDTVKASVGNIDELDPTYMAFEVHGGNELLTRARDRETHASLNVGLLENIPIGIKDIFNTADYPTQMGSPLWKSFTPGNDARAVFNLKRQGALVIGKTVTAEFAVHTLGKTMHPFDMSKNPGTSSTGSAVAVCLGMVPLSIGTQTAGSIVRPASFCGVYACKPSFGTIPRTGMLKTTDTLDTIGFFVIHQQDLRRGFDSLRVSGENYPVSHAALNDGTRQHKPEGRPWRIAFVRTHTWKHVPPYAQDAILSFIEKLSHAGMLVKDVELPDVMKKTHETHETIYNKALSYYFQKEHKQSDFVSPVMNDLITKGNALTVAAYREALDVQTEMVYAMDSFFDDYDILISLSTAGEAPDRYTTELPDPALMWTLTHLPVVSVPNFRSPSGLPFGMQVVARKYNDYLIFQFLDEMCRDGLIPERAGFFINR